MMNEKIKAYCELCDDDVDFDVTIEERDGEVKGTKIKYRYFKAVCKNCGHQVFPSFLAKRNIISMFDAYKEKVGLLTSQDIIDIRKSLGLTQVQFAKRLGCGEKTIARYENGAIQDKMVDRFIRTISQYRFSGFYDVKVFEVSKQEDIQKDYISTFDNTYIYGKTTEKKRKNNQRSLASWTQSPNYI